jgi:hypothetical protein
MKETTHATYTSTAHAERGADKAVKHGREEQTRTEDITMTQTQPKVPLGRLVATPGALAALTAAEQLPHEFLARHLRGDWGDLSTEDQHENEWSLRAGCRLLSAYHTTHGQKLWIITEADRSATTILLPSEY